MILKEITCTMVKEYLIREKKRRIVLG
uniref:Uncharacterized protein n=1 Tax=Lepeophtheirus salmonis TaxID=72036 RepID=A0A0K2VFE1_LEPSM